MARRDELGFEGARAQSGRWLSHASRSSDDLQRTRSNEGAGEQWKERFVMEVIDERVATALRRLTPSERVQQGNVLTMQMRMLAQTMRASARASSAASERVA
jgi:hypothetical protein